MLSAAAIYIVITTQNAQIDIFFQKNSPRLPREGGLHTPGHLTTPLGWINVDQDISNVLLYSSVRS